MGYAITGREKQKFGRHFEVPPGHQKNVVSSTRHGECRSWMVFGVFSLDNPRFIMIVSTAGLNCCATLLCRGLVQNTSALVAIIFDGLNDLFELIRDVLSVQSLKFETET